MTTLPADMDDQHLYAYLLEMPEGERTTYISELSEEERAKVNSLLLMDVDAAELLLTEDGALLHGGYSFLANDQGAIDLWKDDVFVLEIPARAGVGPSDYGIVEITAGAPGEFRVDGNQAEVAELEEEASGDYVREQPQAYDTTGWDAGGSEDEESDDEEAEGVPEAAEDPSAGFTHQRPQAEDYSQWDTGESGDPQQQVEEVMSGGVASMDDEEREDEDAVGEDDPVPPSDAADPQQGVAAVMSGGVASMVDEDEDPLAAHQRELDELLDEGAGTEDEDDTSGSSSGSQWTRGTTTRQSSEAKFSTHRTPPDFIAARTKSEKALADITARDAQQRSTTFMQLDNGQYIFGGDHEVNVVETATGVSGTIRFNRNRLSANDFIVENESGNVDYTDLQNFVRTLLTGVASYDYGDATRVRVK